MFVERLTKKDIVNLMKKLGYCVDFNLIKTENSIQIRFQFNLNPYCLTIEDFSIKLVVNCFDSTKPKHNNLFKLFMKDKFGDEYKTAFNENLRKKYEAEMIK